MNYSDLVVHLVNGKQYTRIVMSDIQVTALLDIVNKKKAEITALEVKPNWVTNCAFKYIE
jgi:hypothetical protein